MAGSRDRKVIELFGPDSLSRRSLYAPSVMEERGNNSATASADAGYQQNQDVVTIGEFTLDRVTGELSSGDDVVVLQPSTLGVLAFLIDHAGQVVGSETLIEAVWPNRIIGDDAVHRRIADLRKQLGDDSRRPRYVETLSRRGYRLIAPVSVATPPNLRRRKRFLQITAAICVVLPMTVYLAWQRQLEIDHQALLDRIANLVEQGDGFNTFLEVQEVRENRPDPTLRILTAGVLHHGRLETDPPGAEVSIRRRPDDPWHHLGTTPLERDFPVGIYSILLEKRGYASRMILEANPGLWFNNTDERSHLLRLQTAEEAEPSTVLVQGGEFLTPFIMTRKRYALDDFLIDRFEVTNAEFRVFVDAGGYENGTFWTDYPDADTNPPHIRFTDSTGTTGPASWEFGSFPTGTESLPVTGVSWYEAQAYVRWSGRHLPTALDWGRAALSPVEWEHPIASVVVESANIVEGSLLPVGESGSLSANGALDLVGNAREWTSSVTHDRGVIVGGSYASPRVQYAFPLRIDPHDRSLINGFRTVTYLGERNAQLVTALEWDDGRHVVFEPVSDEIFEGIRATFTYEPGVIRFHDGRVVSSEIEGHWERRVIQLPTVNPDDPLPVHFFIPKSTNPPYQPVFFVPPSDSFGPTLTTSDIEITDYFLDVIVRDGRALIWPVYTGTHERFDGKWTQQDDTFLAGAARAHRLRRDEVGRVIDYLKDSPEFDGSRIGLIALGFGATFAAHSMLALEPRIRAAVLWNPLYRKNLNPVINPATYWPRVTQPVFAASGRNHHEKERMLPKFLMPMIGTPSDHKLLKIYDGSTWPLPRPELLRDTIDWLDRYLGHLDETAALTD